MRLRQWLYLSGIRKVRSLEAPVISVGNLSMGGTGKTPHVIAIARHLAGIGRHPAIITRGYGGKAGRGPLVISDGNRPLVSPETGGDEPVMMAEELHGTVIVAGSDRYAAGRHAIEKFGADVILLDDGFQHMALARDVDIVLVSAASPFWHGRVFPGGELRESPDAICRRASVVVLTRTELVSSEKARQLKEHIMSVCPGIPVVSSRNVITGFVDLDGRNISIKEICMGPVFAVCAIGEPSSFLKNIAEAGPVVGGRLCYPDHHAYTVTDLGRIVKMASDCGCRYVVMTGKDAVKLRGLFRECSEAVNGSIKPAAARMDVCPEEMFWEVTGRALHGDHAG